jgi:NAD(P)-dependent dehydrogenase (short-subunit alcohol dehydrogenase family)
MSGRLEGRIALITGGSRGIGAAIGAAMAREGAAVVLTSRKQPALDETARAIRDEIPGATVYARACHVGKEEDRDALMAWLDAEVGAADILVNNAGTNVFFGPMLDVDWAAWDKTFEVNLKGPFALSRDVAKRLIAAGRPGSIVNVASVLGQGASPLQGVYGMTKAAIISMTQTLAFEWGGVGIRVNAIAPGLVDTRLAAALVHNKPVVQQFTSRAGIRRVAEPEEMAGAVVFLASDEARYVTGSVINVDGGYRSG